MPKNQQMIFDRRSSRTNGLAVSKSRQRYRYRVLSPVCPRRHDAGHSVLIETGFLGVVSLFVLLALWLMGFLDI